MQISSALLEEVVAHALRDAPNECCGVVAVRDGAAASVHAMQNTAASSFRFEVDPQELHRVMTEIEDRGEMVGAIYHSHTRSAPYPSQTDINFAAPEKGLGWPGTEWIIVGTTGTDPEVRSFLIERDEADGVAVTEVAL